VTETTKGDKALAKLFSPIEIGGMMVKNRLAMAPIGTLYSSHDGALRQEFNDFFIARAKGGVGMITLGEAGMGFTSLEVTVDSALVKRMVRAARELVNRVHDYDVRIGVQLNHFGRQLDSPLQGYQMVAPSPIPWSKRGEVPREISVDEIEELIERHVEAATRITEAGFDFIEVKACHGYLLSSFISPHSNRRNDQYGGNLSGRARFALEIIRRIRLRLGKDVVISCRFNGSDHVDGGLTPEESIGLARLLVEQGVDFLSVTAGVYGSYPVIIPPFHAPQGCYVHLAEGIKRAVSVPVEVVGRIKDPRTAEEVLQSGKADIVAMARALIADPDLPSKAQRGTFDEIRWCIGCNQGCQDREAGQETTCLVNPAAAREKEMAILPAGKPKRVMVIGGGLAGMEAAMAAALRGHEVSVYEEAEELGGQWRLASKPPRKEEFVGLLDYLVGQLRQLGVTIHLGARATSKTVSRESPEVVVIATGAVPAEPEIPGREREDVFTAWDVLAGKVQVGKHVLIIGGNGLGLETAHFLAAQGRKVEVVEQLDRVGSDLGPTVRWHLRHRLAELRVSLLTSTRATGISDEGVVLVDSKGKSTYRAVQGVVLAAGSVSRRELVAEVEGMASEVYVIGDAVRPRNAYFAIREGAEVGRRI